MTMFTHQQFGLIQCKLCRKIYEDPRLLECMHSFCGRCLEKHIAETTRPSDSCMQCPLCQEENALPNSHDDFPRNVMLERFISQAQKDKTTVIAGREVEKISREALSEAELRCPEVVATIQEIATTAGHVLADNIPENLQASDLETVKKKNGLNLKTSQLQVRAMDLVQSIDRVNIAVEEWTDMKSKVRENIKQRSQEMQASIRNTERRLLGQIDDREFESEMKNQAFAVKNKLHRLLKSSLSMVDFLRLLAEFGVKEDLDVYSDLVREREKKLYSGPVVLTQMSYYFEQPHVANDEGLELMFGSLSEISQDTTAWHPSITSHKMETTPNLQPNEYNVDERIKSSQVVDEFNTADDVEYQNEVDENRLNNDFVSRVAMRQFTTPKPRGYSRMVKKSLSVDCGVVAGPYDYVKSDSSQSPYLSQTNNTTEFQILNENETDRIATANATNGRHAAATDSSFHTAIESLVSTAKAMQPMGQMPRRLSAPPSMIIDGVNRRRLSALSILERSNINTDGLNVTTDIESGMNEARQEWLRENLKRKIEQGDTIQESV